jgi:hypothetical protein
VRNQMLIKEAILKADHAFVYDNSALNRPAERAIDLKLGKVARDRRAGSCVGPRSLCEGLEKFSPARLNAPAASFADAKGIAEKFAGPGAQLRIPNHGRNSAIRGEIIGETAEHWVQRVDEQSFIAHFKSALPSQIQLHKVYEISYPQRGRGVAQELSPRL